MVGGLLAASGAIMQGLFRNPLADPALVGVSCGGAFAAAAAIVFTDSQIGESFRFMQNQLLPLAAFAGSLVTTVILYGIASRSGRTSIAIFLLAGLAIAAIANAGIGLLVFIADDRQLRDITFWLLGSLSGATWTKTRHARAGAGAGADRLRRRSRAGSMCWCSARPRRFTAASTSSD